MLEAKASMIEHMRVTTIVDPWQHRDTSNDNGHNADTNNDSDDDNQSNNNQATVRINTKLAIQVSNNAKS